MKPEIQPLPRKMWANLYLDSGFIYPTKKQAEKMGSSGNATHLAVAVAVIPLNDVGKMLEAAIDGVLRDRIP